VILQIVPASGEWRLVRAVLGNDSEDLGSQEDDGLFYVTPIACFALVQSDDMNVPPTVMPVVPEDWPQYLWPLEDTPGNGVIGYLGPREEIGQSDVDWREEAIAEIRRFRAHVERAAQELDR
jgi:hypothetical protein